ncbi:hypothetical protein BC939DRAFT_468584 [Gamsiella multidivaricata]|uniref:uncharacterized protein n=1 Tax=Gamsiella multidivaricata TaxID=101098 RepID=UPI00221E97D2|nr:uncharacterized protein BC939DRAFT_468584 [Gamsiella multidivaricata]KAI7816609.1 hypothetical protein BC939DRAFT_468584 [Gamsiella multidivaricata]
MQVNNKKDVIKSAPGWSPEKATESEADVKADREPSPSNIRELQEETIEIIVEKEDSNGNIFEKTTQKLKHTIEEVEDSGGRAEENMVKNGEKVIEKMAHRAEEVGAALGKTTGTVKNRVEYAEDSVKHEVKTGAQKVSEFVKESIDSVKKTVGLGGNGSTTEKIKQKVKKADDRVDSDRGA